MGNSQLGECRSICGFDLITSEDLRKTSLQRDSFKKPLIKSCSTLPATQNVLDQDPLPEDKSKIVEITPLKSANTKKNPNFQYNFKDVKEGKEKQNLSEYDFKIIQILADGRYGRVCAVKLDQSEEMYTMKIICKKRVRNGSETGVEIIEKDILEKAHHAFIPKLLHTFENERKFFLVMEYLEGGELHKILHKLTRFSEEITRFYAAEALLALEYLHEELKVIYNNLEPENVLLDQGGHIRLTDFDQAQKIENIENQKLLNLKDNLPSLVINKVPTEVMSDYWKLGYFIYELLTGIKPYKYGGKSLEEIEKQISSKSLSWPKFISKSARDLIERLINPKVEERLGFNGIQDIKNHNFFAGINWDKLLHKSVYPPFNPMQFKENLQEEEEIEEESEDIYNTSLEVENENENKTKKNTNFLDILSASLPRQGLHDKSPENISRSS